MCFSTTQLLVLLVAWPPGPCPFTNCSSSSLSFRASRAGRSFLPAAWMGVTAVPGDDSVGLPTRQRPRGTGHILASGAGKRNQPEALMGRELLLAPDLSQTKRRAFGNVCLLSGTLLALRQPLEAISDDARSCWGVETPHLATHTSPACHQLGGSSSTGPAG